MQRHLIDYIRRPETLDAQAVSHLREMVGRYPYCHSAHILLLGALYRQHDSSFDQMLRRTAVLIPDRTAIFNQIEKKNYLADEEHRKFPSRATAEMDDTSRVLDSLLDSLPQEPAPARRGTIDASQDYIGFMLQQQGEEFDVAEADSGLDIIDEFLQKPHPRISLQNADDQAPEELQAGESQIAPKNEILTETLAHIYIKQGKFDKAIEIIRRLSLKYPKKNRYFADQIRFLEKIIINNRNK